MAVFDGFDLTDFWDDSDYARKSYVEPPLTDEAIADVERELGVRLPAAYVALMRTQNGGIPRRDRFRTEGPTSWAEDHVAITGIAGIGRARDYSLCGRLGSRFMQREWGYPEIGVVICDCPSAGHDLVMLDYRACGPMGEPQVVHVDQESDYAITFLASDFETFVRGLVHASDFDTEELDQALVLVERGAFSPLLAEIIDGSGEPEAASTLRHVCRSVTIEKGSFALHGDPKSWLVYDLLFHLYATARSVRSADDYLSVYPELIALGDAGFTTGGYAPAFVEAWLADRIRTGVIEARADGALQLTREAVAELRRRVEQV
jgi:hypothetical protein